MQKLVDIIKKDNVSVSKDTHVSDAVKIMHQNGEGCVVILESDKPVGILTERDVVSFLSKHTDLEQSVFSVGSKSIISINIERSIEYALHILIDNHIRRLVVFDNDGFFVGIVTQDMLANVLETEHYRVNLKVSQVLSSSSQEIITLDVQSRLEDVVEKMYVSAVGSVLISEDGAIVGIVTERDIVRFVSTNAEVITPISEVMSRPVINVDMHDTVEFVVKLMHEKQIRRVVVSDTDGNAIGVIGTRDIIKNIKGNYGLFVENKLKYTKQALNTINEVIFELYNENSSMLIQWGNMMAVQRYGSEIIDHSITSLIDKDTWSKITEVLLRDGEVIDYKMAIREQQYLLSCSQCKKGEKTEAFFIICKDVTDYELRLLSLNKSLDSRVKEEIAKNEKQAEQLFAQKRMMQMGEMISMIAHQWRQPLGSISATAVNLKLKLELEVFDLESKEGIEEASQYFEKRLKKIEDYVQNLTTTIDDFRNFYKPNKESVSIRLQELVLKSLNIIHGSLEGSGIEVIEEYNSQDEIELYDSEMVQVILNLLKNAQDNLEEKKIKNPYIKIIAKNRTISICDNGGGISEDIKEKIFDPYFSTKDEKNGTGLGLYMSKTIVEEHHNGKLEVQNTDEGVCFRIKL